MVSVNFPFTLLFFGLTLFFRSCTKCCRVLTIHVTPKTTMLLCYIDNYLKLRNIKVNLEESVLIITL